LNSRRLTVAAVCGESRFREVTTLVTGCYQGVQRLPLTGIG